MFLAALSMLGPFSIDTIFPAFPPIGREFAADPVAMQQTVSVYLISYAVMSLFLGPWSDAYGRKPVTLPRRRPSSLACSGSRPPGFPGFLCP
jgi:MFS transporter, DHA1 family, multidrug resistance protein